MGCRLTLPECKHIFRIGGVCSNFLKENYDFHANRFSHGSVSGTSRSSLDD